MACLIEPIRPKLRERGVQARDLEIAYNREMTPVVSALREAVNAIITCLSAHSDAGVVVGTATLALGTLSFGTGGNVTFGLDGSTLTASAPAGGGGGGGVALTAAGGFISSGTASLANGGGVSVGIAGQTITWSVGAGATATGNLGAVVIAGNTAGALATITAGTITLAGGANVTLSQAGNAITIVGGAGGGGGIAISASNALITSGTASLVNANGVSWSVNGQSISASVAAGATATGNLGAISASNALITSGTVSLVNANGVSWSVNGQSISASVGAGATATGNLGAISASNALITSGTVSLVNANGVSWSVNGQSISASVGAGATATGNLGALAAGTQTATSGTIVFANSNNITFGMSGSTQITASFNAGAAAAPTLSSLWLLHATSTGIAAASNATMFLHPVTLANQLTVTRFEWVASQNPASGSTGGYTVSVGLYTMSGSTLSLASSGSFGLTWTSGTAAQSSITGMRPRTFSLGSWALTPGHYMLAFWARSTNNGPPLPAFWSSVANVELNTGIMTQPRVGLSSASFSTAMPASINLTATAYERRSAWFPAFTLIGSGP